MATGDQTEAKTDDEPAEGGEADLPKAEPKVDTYEVNEVKAEPSQAQPKNRRERRAAALQEADGRATKWERDATETRQRYERLDREFAEFRGKIEERDRQSQQRQPSKHADALKNLRSQWETHAAAAVDSKIDAGTRRQHIERAHELETEIARAQYKMFQEEHAANAPADQSAAREAAAKEEQYLEARFPWLEGNEEAHGYSWSKFRGLVAAGKPANRATMVEACTFVAKQFGFGGSTDNPNGNSRRFAAVPGGESGDDDDSPMTVRVGEAEKKLARAMFPKESEGDAVRLWIKEVAGPATKAKRNSA